jgi:hypothetical protein
MVGDSTSYKRYLIATAAKLARWHDEARWTHRRVEAVERSVFISYFFIRKLIENDKLTVDVVEQPIPIRFYPPTGIRVDRRSRNDFWELYNMQEPRNETRPLAFLCHQIVHSYVFALSGTRKRTNILVSSDRHRRRGLFEISHATFMRTLHAVGTDDPSGGTMVFDGVSDDYVLKLTR